MEVEIARVRVVLGERWAASSADVLSSTWFHSDRKQEF